MTDLADDKDSQLKRLAASLTPENPIRSSEFLRGRETQLDSLVRELIYFKPTIFIFGQRGVGKTSLARTAAQTVTTAGREHVYAACSPDSTALSVLRNVCLDLLSIAISENSVSTITTRTEFSLSIAPSLKTSFERSIPQIEEFDRSTDAVRVMRDLDRVLEHSSQLVVVIDELEELDKSDRSALAHLVKQIGDEEVGLRFVLVGIAANVHELIGSHESVPRYLLEVSLDPLLPQHIMDIVSDAADNLNISISEQYLTRIAIIGNGFPHFAHLMGKHLLIQAILEGADAISKPIYSEGVKAAVAGSIQELRITYEQATQRDSDHFKHLIWALANSNVVDVKTSDWKRLYVELTSEHHFQRIEQSKLTNAIGNFKKETYGRIIVNTPARYGSKETRYNFRRFTSPLMRGHVRLQAANEGVELGSLDIAG